MQEIEGGKNNMSKIKDARNRVQKYQTGGEVRRADRYGRLTGVPRVDDISNTVRQRNFQGLGRQNRPQPRSGITQGIQEQEWMAQQELQNQRLLEQEQMAQQQMLIEQEKIASDQMMQEQEVSPPVQPDPKVPNPRPYSLGYRPPPNPFGQGGISAGYKKGGKVTNKKRRK